MILLHLLIIKQILIRFERPTIAIRHSVLEISNVAL